MTTPTLDQMKAKVAEFDGYKLKPNNTLSRTKSVYYKKGVRLMLISDFKYDTDMGQLYPVWQKLRTALLTTDGSIREVAYMQHYVKICEQLKSGSPACEIFTSVHAAIEFINKYKKS